MDRSAVKPRQEKRHSIGGFPSYGRGKTEFFFREEEFPYRPFGVL